MPEFEPKIIIQINNPAVQVAMTQLRSKDSKPGENMALTDMISTMIAAEVSKFMMTKPVGTTTRTGDVHHGMTYDGLIALVPVMRAGAALLRGFRTVFPNISLVWHYSCYRNETSLETVVVDESKIPTWDEGFQMVRLTVALDPMFATGGTAVTVVSALKAKGHKNIMFVALIAAPEAFVRFHEVHPDVPVIIVEIDGRLDDRGYIRDAGIGDFGDMMYPRTPEDLGR